MRPFLSVLLLFAIASPLRAGESAGKVRLMQNEKQKTVEVKIDGDQFAVYQYSNEFRKPFFLPVYAPGQVQVTRDLDDPNDKDHPHHKGIWVSVDEVNGIRFWNEDGKIENQSVEVTSESDQAGELTVVNHWLGKEGQPILREKTIITIYANRVMAYDITLTALDKEVTFEDTKEGFFAFRMFPTMKESQTGKAVSAEGVEGTKNLWGKATPWIDYSGTVDGKTVGVTLFDHPDNPRPSRYHVRNYGLFAISPFGEKSYTNGANPASPVTLKPDASLNLKYGIYIHAGNSEEGRVKETYQQYVERTKSE